MKLNKNWNRIRGFYQVANAGSFSEAGRSLSISQSSVSRLVSNLEEALGVKLFHRCHHGVKLTNQGRVLFDVAHRMFSEFEKTTNKLCEDDREVRGELKIAIEPALGSNWFLNLLPEFFSLYPNIKLSVLEIHESLNFTGIDIVIGFSRHSIPKFLKRRIGKFNFGLYASSGYLNNHGAPVETSDLSQHKLIVMGTDPHNLSKDTEWVLDVGSDGEGKKEPSMMVGTADDLFIMGNAGLGIIPFAEESSSLSGSNLTRVLPEISGPIEEIICHYPGYLENSGRLTTLLEFLDSVQAKELLPVKVTKELDTDSQNLPF